MQDCLWLPFAHLLTASAEWTDYRWKSQKEGALWRDISLNRRIRCCEDRYLGSNGLQVLFVEGFTLLP